MLFCVNLSIQVHPEGVQSIFQRCSKRPHQLLLSRNFPLSFVRLANLFPTFFRNSEIGGIPKKRKEHHCLLLYQATA